MTYFEKPDTPADALEHFGRKGMKWGVRRTPEQLGVRRAKTVAKRDKLASKAVSTTARVDRATRRQNEAMIKFAKTGRRKHRKALAKHLNATNRAIKRDERIDRHIKRLDKRVKRIDKRVTKLGEREAQRILKELEDG